VVADFGCAIHAVNKTQLDWGGGYLLATGCYLSMLASYCFRTPDGRPQRPTKVHAVGQLLEEQRTDAWANVTLEYEEGKKQAALYYTGLVNSPCGASINGPKGQLHIPSDFWSPVKLWKKVEGVEKREELDFQMLPNRFGNGEVATAWKYNPVKSPGLSFEADHVYQCIRGGWRGRIKKRIF